VRLSVRDTGTGMTDEVKAHLFEPFFTTKPRGKGTGLGLAVVHGIVAQHHGEIVVDSTPGRGTTFSIFFPASAEPARRAAPEAEAPPRGGTETVLVVDDDELIRAMIARGLERLGYRVLVAASGYEALGLVDAAGVTVDLLVSDVVMPGLGGRALADALRRRRPGLRVLFMSGHVAERVDAAAHPARAFLQKPFTLARLGARVREALDGPAAGGPTPIAALAPPAGEEGA
jgi:CheY-like chemotaxis protein